MRNRFSYEGFSIKADYLERNESKLKEIINVITKKVKGLLEGTDDLRCRLCLGVDHSHQPSLAYRVVQAAQAGVRRTVLCVLSGSKDLSRGDHSALGEETDHVTLKFG